MTSMTAVKNSPTGGQSDLWRRRTTHRQDRLAHILAQFGAVQIYSSMASAAGLYRTPQRSRQADADTFQFMLAQHDRNIGARDGRGSSRPMNMILIDSSRPYPAQEIADDTARCVVVAFPRTLLPLPTAMVRRLTNKILPGRTGIGVLFSEVLARLISDGDQYRTADAPRLGAVVIDLLAVLLTEEYTAAASVPPAPPHQHSLLQQIHAHIQRHLASPGLSPQTIAAAHNISTRTLHRLFQDHDSTIAEWIRARRLDRIRHDMVDPHLRDRPIHAIAARWGFTDPAHFSRTFRAAHGITPHSYRKQHLQPRHAHAS
jgi:AraC-like DNA-binding protein